MIVFLPILLQLSLAMFFIGLLFQLWSLDILIAQISTALVVITLTFLIGTSLLPAFFRSCPYRSPQAYAFYLSVKIGTAIAIGIAVIASMMAAYVVGKYLRVARAFDVMTSPILALFRASLETIRPAWDLLDAQTSGTSPGSLNRQFLLEADWNFAIDDEEISRAFVACIDGMEYTDAALALRDLFHQATRRSLGMAIMMKKLLQLLDTYKEKDAEAKKQVLRAVKKVNVAFEKYCDTDVATLKLYRDIQNRLADALVQPTADGDHHLQQRLCSDLDNALGVSLTSKNILPVEYDPIVFDAVVSTGSSVLDNMYDTDLFYKICTTGLRLCTETNISPKELAQRRDHLQDLIIQLRNHLSKHGFCDNKGKVGDDSQYCFLELATTLLNTMVKLAEQYPEYEDPITRTIEVYAKRVNTDIADFCIDAIELSKFHSPGHPERFDLIEKAHSWVRSHPLAPEGHQKLVRSSGLSGLAL